MRQNKTSILVMILIVTTIFAVCLSFSKYQKVSATDVETIVALNEFSTVLDEVKLEKIGPR